MTRVVVDADYLAYLCGFAVEKVLYDVSVERPDGSTDEAVFRTRDEVDAYCVEEPEGTRIQVDRLIDSEPLDHALFLVNRTLLGVEEKLTAAGLEFNRLELFLTGKVTSVIRWQPSRVTRRIGWSLAAPSTTSPSGATSLTAGALRRWMGSRPMMRLLGPPQPVSTIRLACVSCQ